jgi:hypothetical protein
MSWILSFSRPNRFRVAFIATKGKATMKPHLRLIAAAIV